LFFVINDLKQEHSKPVPAVSDNFVRSSRLAARYGSSYSRLIFEIRLLEGTSTAGLARLEKGIVEFDINIEEKFRGMGYGSGIIDEAFQVWGDQIKGIKSTWTTSEYYKATGKSDNLIAFNKAIADGLTPEEAAFSTWTGTIAKDKGFDKAAIDWEQTVYDEKTKEYSNVVVTFTK